MTIEYMHTDLNFQEKSETCHIAPYHKAVFDISLTFENRT